MKGLFAEAREAPRAEGRKRPLAVVGLFAGIGGIELGLRRAGHQSRLLCEIDEPARAVLGHHFPEIELHDDVRTLRRLPVGTDLVAAGFPCQDLSQAGMTRGISGARSGLVGEVFRLLRKNSVPWVLLENVPFMLQLAKGRALDVIVSELEAIGYRWCYRVVDTMAFGLPQRRQRVFLLASLDADPRPILFTDDAGEHLPRPNGRTAYGFYWTEGSRGLGLAIDSVPTLKGGSTIGIPSPPAILTHEGDVITPDIRDAERLQGFPANWTKAVESVARKTLRWKLVGNAVTVDVARWIGKRLRNPGSYDDTCDVPLRREGSWPRAAWNIDGERFQADTSSWPVRTAMTPITEFVRYPPRPLSHRATAGFMARLSQSSLRTPACFRERVTQHRDRMAEARAGAAV